MKGTPYGSFDVGHVPPPDPELFWLFAIGHERVIAAGPLLTFKVTAIHDTWVEGEQFLGGQCVSGELHIDRPVVIARLGTGEPLVTLTLRKIEDGNAFLQVTANPAEMRVEFRQ